VNPSLNIAFPNAVLLLMAMLDDRHEPEDAAVQRRAVMGALKSWASGETPAPTALEQACDDVQEILDRFLTSRAADLSTQSRA